VEIAIAIGNAHLGKVRNKTFSLDALAEMLLTHRIGEETLAEFNLLPLEEQNRKKRETGFFLAGTSIDGRRRSASIEKRTLITLDIDNISAEDFEELTDGFAPLCKYHWFVHSTRKHSAEKPRIRIVIPIKKPISPDKYEAVARLCAGMVNTDPQKAIDAVDPCCFRVAQMMYFPSACKDSEIVADVNPGIVLDAEALLDTVPEWRQGKGIPISKLHSHSNLHLSLGQTSIQDPTRKKGIIGAFCRTYNILEAIDKFLPDRYEMSSYDAAGIRLTYNGGSSKNGACVYDNENHLYSHHQTDPVAHRCVNSFDLVRIHLFGEMDEGYQDLPLNELPSFSEMKRLCDQDAEVSRLIEREKLETLVGDFEEMEGAADSEEETEEFENEEDFSENEGAVLPLEIFGDFFAQKLTKWAEAVGSSPDYAAGTLLAVTAALIGNTRRVKVHSEWKEPCVLWVQLVGTPSSKKSPAIDTVLRHVRSIENDWNKEYQQQFQIWKERNKQDKEDEKGPFETEPVRKRLVINDTTSEMVPRLSSQHKRGLLLYRDELSGWYQSLNQYKNGKGSDRAMWLEAYGGRSYTVDRVREKGESISIERFSVSVIGGIQPDKILEMARSSQDGLVERFIPFWPGKKEYTFPEQVANMEDVKHIFQSILDLGFDAEGNPVDLPLSEEALAKFKDWSLNRVRTEPDDSTRLSGAWGKAEGLVLRLSMVFEHLWWAEDLFSGNPAPQEISLKALQSAIALREKYIAPMQKKVFERAEENQEDLLLGKMLDVLKTSGNKGAAKRDLMRGPRALRELTVRSFDELINKAIMLDFCRVKEKAASNNKKTLYFYITEAGLNFLENRC
jgi:hypothetical protein